MISTFARAALLGSAFTTDELLAVSGVDEDRTYRYLDVALSAMVVERTEAGYRFRHALVRDALLQAMPPGGQSTARREIASALAETNAAPGRVARQFLAAGLPERAVPYAVRAVETAGGLGAYRATRGLVERGPGSRGTGRSAALTRPPRRSATCPRRPRSGPGVPGCGCRHQWNRASARPGPAGTRSRIYR